MSRYLISLATFGFILKLLFGFVGSAYAGQNNILAINIALAPDEAMTQYAETANTRLLKAYPLGFVLGDTHKPHITLLQRYVRTENLNKIYAALENVLAGEKITSWKLKATRYNFTPWKNSFLGSIAIEPNNNLISLQQKLITAIAPFSEQTGTASAFVITPEEPDIDKTTIHYVTTFVPNQIGTKFYPHVTIGIIGQNAKKDLVEEPFIPFTFSPVAVSVYQIGNFGTARKTLKTWH